MNLRYLPKDFIGLKSILIHALDLKQQLFTFKAKTFSMSLWSECRKLLQLSLKCKVMFLKCILRAVSLYLKKKNVSTQFNGILFQFSSV